MSDSKKNEEELKALTRKIMELLVHNEEIISMLLDLKARKIIDSSTLLGLALKVSELVEVSGRAFSQNDLGESEKKAEPATGVNQPTQALQTTPSQTPASTATTAKERAIIDGRDLTPKEQAFEEYVNSNFKDEEWLRENGLIY